MRSNKPAKQMSIYTPHDSQDGASTLLHLIFTWAISNVSSNIEMSGLRVFSFGRFAVLDRASHLQPVTCTCFRVMAALGKLRSQ